MSSIKLCLCIHHIPCKLTRQGLATSSASFAMHTILIVDRTRGGGREILRYEDFTKVVDGMKCFPEKIKKIHLYSLGEPLLNKRLPDMIKYIKDANVAECISITTNGSLLTPELSCAIVKAGLDELKISVEGVGQDAYERVCGARIDWDSFVNNIKYLYEHKGKMFLYVKTIDACLSDEEDKKKFYEIFGDICDNVFIECLVDHSLDFKEIHDSFDFNKFGKTGQFGQTVSKMDICPMPFYMGVINPNGAVTLCCEDWEQKIVIGNAFDENICDIWNGQKHTDFLKRMIMQGRSGVDVCSKCLAPCYNMKQGSNLDGHKTELIKAFGIEALPLEQKPLL